ncbi:MAG: acyltransferase [Oxalobacter sp.]|nr:acyltransferase [Oxalobacter sp.]
MKEKAIDNPDIGKIPAQKSSLGWRPDIDGLRAFAVFAVFAFHAFPRLSFLKGGFVGVDVFFVISGFLISSIIYTQLAKGTFSFWNFYSRRIRRIYPVLLTVLIACLGFGAFFLLADEYQQLGKHVAGGAGFVSNIILFREKGYFDNASATKPLLHLWSLGIEEQFYIFWPLILWLTWKFKKNAMFWVAFVIATSSLVMNLYWFKTKPDMDFFMPHTRIWELLCGAMLAWGNLHWKERAGIVKARLGGDRLNHFLSINGFILLVVSIVFMQEKGFPGWQAILPIVATVLIIMAGKDAILNRWILSNKVLVWFGLISYPMYLWHWPLISMKRVIHGEHPSVGYCISAFVVCTVLAWLTTRFIENPLRFGEHGKAKTVGLFLAMIVLGSVGLAISAKKGIPQRYLDSQTIEKNNFLEKVKKESQLRCNAFFSEWNSIKGINCRFQHEPGKNNIAVIGDSHASHLFIGMTQFTGKGEGVAAFPASGTPPFIGVQENKKFYRFHQKAWQYITEHPEIKVVVLAHRPHKTFGEILDTNHPTEKDPRRIMENGMRHTFSYLRDLGKQVLVVLDSPELPYHAKVLEYRPFIGRLKDGVFNRKFYDDTESIAIYNRQISTVAEEFPNVHIIDLAKYLCDEHKCYAVKDGKILYKDGDHLSNDGSLYVAPYLMEKIREISK